MSIRQCHLCQVVRSIFLLLSFFPLVLQFVLKFLSASDRVPVVLQDGTRPDLAAHIYLLAIMATDHPKPSPSSGLAGLPALIWEIAGSYAGIMDRLASAGQCEKPQTSWLSSIPLASRFYTSAMLTRLQTFSAQSTAASAPATPRCSGTPATSRSRGGSKMSVSDRRPAAPSIHADGQPMSYGRRLPCRFGLLFIFFPSSLPSCSGIFLLPKPSC